MPEPRMTNAQRASLNSLKAIAAGSYKTIVIGNPDPGHAGEYASLFVGIVSQDVTSKSSPPPQSTQRYLIEAGGCIARIYE